MTEPIDYKELAKIGVYGFEVRWRIKEPLWRSGVATAVTQDDAVQVGRKLVEAADWAEYEYEITLYERFMRKWIYSWDSSKERVAPPGHRVFICMGGTDCDGFSWSSYDSFKTLEDATEYVNDSLAHADGPTGYSTMSCDDWEMAGYPEYRDRYAEAAGY